MKRLHNLSIRVKVAAILAIVFVGYTTFEQVVDRTSIRRAMQHYENEQAIKDLQRSEQAIRREMFHLTVFTGDWAAWDDTYEFVETLDAEYIESISCSKHSTITAST